MVTIDAEDAACLRRIALLGGCKGPVRLSTQALGDQLESASTGGLQSLEKAQMISESASRPRTPKIHRKNR